MTDGIMEPSMLTGIELGPEPPTPHHSLFQHYHLPAALTYRWKVTPWLCAGPGHVQMRVSLLPSLIATFGGHGGEELNWGRKGREPVVICSPSFSPKLLVLQEGNENRQGPDQAPGAWEMIRRAGKPLGDKSEQRSGVKNKKGEDGDWGNQVCVCEWEKEELVKVSDSDECTKQVILL